MLAAGILAWPADRLEAAEAFRIDGGVRPVAVRMRRTPAILSAAQATPLEGPLVRVALTLTDQADPDLVGLASMHTSLAGAFLSGNPPGVVTALLDSGAGTHLVGYGDSLTLGLGDAFLSYSTFQAGGVGGSIDLMMSMPVGFFAHGLQDLEPGGGVNIPRLQGQGNFVGGVNLEENAAAGIELPTLLGAPFLAHFAAWIRNSQPVAVPGTNGYAFSPAVTFLAPDAPGLTSLTHRVYLDVQPTAGDPQYFDLLEEPFTPTSIGLGGSLFMTANNVTVGANGATTLGRALVDTGAQATLISEITATELNLDVRHPDFEMDVQGIGGIVTAPGFLLDRLSLPAQGGFLVWSNVPVVVLNVASPDPAAGTLFGVLGMNLFGNRDLLFNGGVPVPYLDVSDPVVLPDMRITAVQPELAGSVQVAWHAQPAPGSLVLEWTPDLSPAAWAPAATAALSTITGAFSITSGADRAFYRLTSP